MIGVIVKTKDAQLFETLKTHAESTNEPALIGLMQWFESQGDWTLQIAKYIRQAHTVPGAKAKIKAL